MIRNPRQAPWITVIGGANTSDEIKKLAGEVGRLLAKSSAVIVCGGLGGVMEAVSKAAKEADGTVVGILPTESRTNANRYIDFAIPTGMGIGRNLLVVMAGDAIIAIDGGWGTLSEIALAKNLGKHVIGLRKIEIGGIDIVSSPKDAVKLALDYALKKINRRKNKDR